MPFVIPANVTFLMPRLGDSFLVSDTSISVQWSSCDVGVYPHLLNLSLWQNGVMLSTLASNIDDTGKVINQVSIGGHTLCLNTNYAHIVMFWLSFTISPIRILSMVQRSPRGFQLYAATFFSPSHRVFRSLYSWIGQHCYQCWYSGGVPWMCLGPAHVDVAAIADDCRWISFSVTLHKGNAAGIWSRGRRQCMRGRTCMASSHFLCFCSG